MDGRPTISIYVDDTFVEIYGKQDNEVKACMIQITHKI